MEKVRDTQQNKSNSILTLIASPLLLLSVLFLSLVFSILIEFVGMTWFWNDEGAEHSKKMLLSEITYLNDGAKKSIFSSSPVDMARSATDQVHDIFDYIGINSTIRTLQQPLTEEDSRFISNLKVLFQNISEYVYAAITVTELFVVRMLITALSLPVFILFGAGALIDGLVQRDLRKFGGGNESSFLYHKVKRGLKPTIIVSVLVYLSVPISIHPNLVFTPCAMLFGLFLFITATTFKKSL